MSNHVQAPITPAKARGSSLLMQLEEALWTSPVFVDS